MPAPWNFLWGKSIRSFGDRLGKQPKWIAFTEDKLNTAVEKASLVGELYFYQVQKAAIKGILNHLVTIEMPYVKTNAEIEYNGVRIDVKWQKKATNKSKRLLRKLKKIISEYQLSVPPRDQELKKLFKKAGVLDKFKVNGEVSFEKDILKENKAAHPAISLILALYKTTSIVNDKILKGDYQDAKNRIYPAYNQLGTDTGRLSSENPNIMGLNGILRPLIIPKKRAFDRGSRLVSG